MAQVGEWTRDIASGAAFRQQAEMADGMMVGAQRSYFDPIKSRQLNSQGSALGDGTFKRGILNDVSATGLYEDGIVGRPRKAASAAMRSAKVSGDGGMFGILLSFLFK